jgi:hypothetical protein
LSTVLEGKSDWTTVLEGKSDWTTVLEGKLDWTTVLEGKTDWTGRKGALYWQERQIEEWEKRGTRRLIY